MDWRARAVEVYRPGAATLELSATLYEPDTLHTSLLLGFSCPLATLFKDITRDAV